MQKALFKHMKTLFKFNIKFYNHLRTFDIEGYVYSTCFILLNVLNSFYDKTFFGFIFSRGHCIH